MVLLDNLSRNRCNNFDMDVNDLNLENDADESKRCLTLLLIFLVKCFNTEQLKLFILVVSFDIKMYM